MKGRLRKTLAAGLSLMVIAAGVPAVSGGAVIPGTHIAVSAAELRADTYISSVAQGDVLISGDEGISVYNDRGVSLRIRIDDGTGAAMDAYPIVVQAGDAYKPEPGTDYEVIECCYSESVGTFMTLRQKKKPSSASVTPAGSGSIFFNAVGDGTIYTANANPGYYFEKWTYSFGDQEYEASGRSITLEGAENVKAHFKSAAEAAEEAEEAKRKEEKDPAVAESLDLLADKEYVAPNIENIKETEDVEDADTPEASNSGEDGAGDNYRSQLDLRAEITEHDVIHVKWNRVRIAKRYRLYEIKPDGTFELVVTSPQKYGFWFAPGKYGTYKYAVSLLIDGKWTEITEKDILTVDFTCTGYVSSGHG